MTEFTRGDAVTTEYGSGTVTESTARSVTIRLGSGDRINVQRGTPGYGRIGVDLWSLDEVTCAACGGARLDVMTCEGSFHCDVTGCECVVTRNGSCDRFDGMYACAGHPFPSHRGCPRCDPPERDGR